MSEIDITKINIPFPITTERLTLRNVLPGDGAVMFAAKAESMEELYRWMPWAKELGTVENNETVAIENHERFLKREDIMILGFKKDARLPNGTVTDHHWYARFDDKNLPQLKVTW